MDDPYIDNGLGMLDDPEVLEYTDEDWDRFFPNPPTPLASQASKGIHHDTNTSPDDAIAVMPVEGDSEQGGASASLEARTSATGPGGREDGDDDDELGVSFDQDGKVLYAIILMRKVCLSHLAGVKGRIMLEKGTAIGKGRVDVDNLILACDEIWDAENADPDRLTGRRRYAALTSAQRSDLTWTTDMSRYVIRKTQAKSAKLEWSLVGLEYPRWVNVQAPTQTPTEDMLSDDQREELANQGADGELRPWWLTYWARKSQSSVAKKRVTASKSSVAELRESIQSDKSLPVRFDGVANWEDIKTKNSLSSRRFLVNVRGLAEDLAARRDAGAASGADGDERYGYMVTSTRRDGLELQYGRIDGSTS